MPTPAGSDETAVEDDAEALKVAEPNMHEDIQEQKELIAKLKADRAAAQAKKLAATASERETQESTETEDNVASKRQREDESEGYRFNFKEPGEEVGDRTIATNSRVRMAPERKSLAWGALAFAAGMSAM